MGNSGVRQALRRLVMREAKYTCSSCGLQGRELRTKGPYARNACFTYPTTIEGVWLSIDHVVPRSRGGESEGWNLRVLCTLCNGLRGAPPSVEISFPEEHW